MVSSGWNRFSPVELSTVRETQSLSDDILHDTRRPGVPPIEDVSAELARKSQNESLALESLSAAQIALETSPHRQIRTQASNPVNVQTTIMDRESDRLQTGQSTVLPLTSARVSQTVYPTIASALNRTAPVRPIASNLTVRRAQNHTQLPLGPLSRSASVQSVPTSRLVSNPPSINTNKVVLGPRVRPVNIARSDQRTGVPHGPDLDLKSRRTASKGVDIKVAKLPSAATTKIPPSRNTSANSSTRPLEPPARLATVMRAPISRKVAATTTNARTTRALPRSVSGPPRTTQSNPRTVDTENSGHLPRAAGPALAQNHSQKSSPRKRTRDGSFMRDTGFESKRRRSEHTDVGRRKGLHVYEDS